MLKRIKGKKKMDCFIALDRPRRLAEKKTRRAIERGWS